MTTKELKKYLAMSEPAIYETIGRSLNKSDVTLDLLVRHYQWIYQFGDYHKNDMGAKMNANYKLIFTHVMENDKFECNTFLNNFIRSIKIAFDQNFQIWDKEIIINILIHNRTFFWYDLLAAYTLIAGNYDDIRPLLTKLDLDKTIKIPLKRCIKLFDLIVTNDFADQLIKAYVLDLKKDNKNY